MSGDATIAATPLPALIIDETLAAFYVCMIVGGAVALCGRWHSSVALVRWYWFSLTIGAVFRTIKFAVPQFAFYKPFVDPPVVQSSDWWIMLGEWVVFVAGNACTIISYTLILRMWHNALCIVAYSGRQAPVWPQMVLLHIVALSIVTDAVLTGLLAFVTPDTVNVINAAKDAILGIIISLFFLGYWWFLRQSLRQIADLGAGRSLPSNGAAFSMDNTIGEKASRKLRRISWVSVVCTIGSLFRTGELVYFALGVTHILHFGHADEVSVTIQRFVLFFVIDIAPGIAMLVVMMKCGPRPSTSTSTGGRNALTPMKVHGAAHGGHRHSTSSATSHAVRSPRYLPLQ